MMTFLILFQFLGVTLILVIGVYYVLLIKQGKQTKNIILSFLQ